MTVVTVLVVESTGGGTIGVDVHVGQGTVSVTVAGGTVTVSLCEGTGAGVVVTSQRVV
jgi:hypothetical protein